MYTAQTVNVFCGGIPIFSCARGLGCLEIELPGGGGWFRFCKTVSVDLLIRGTQRIVSVNYLFARSLIPYVFVKGILTSNFRNMGNLRPGVFGFIHTEKRSAKIFGKEIRPKVFGKWTKTP